MSYDVSGVLTAVLWASVIGMALGRVLDQLAPGLPSRVVLFSSSGRAIETPGSGQPLRARQGH